MERVTSGGAEGNALANSRSSSGEPFEATSSFRSSFSSSNFPSANMENLSGYGLYPVAFSLERRALPEHRMSVRGKPKLGQRGVGNDHGLTIYREHCCSLFAAA